jgi:hypothetical protein
MSIASGGLAGSSFSHLNCAWPSVNCANFECAGTLLLLTFGATMNCASTENVPPSRAVKLRPVPAKDPH